MNQVVKLIKIISNQIDVKMQILLTNAGLTNPQVRILMYIIENDCENQKQICEIFKLSSPTVNGILNRLEDKGYIEREKLIDKRNNKIVATHKAYEIQRLFKEAVEYNDEILSKNLTEKEISDLNILLSQILKNIEEGPYDKNFSKKH